MISISHVIIQEYGNEKIIQKLCMYLVNPEEVTYLFFG